MDYSIKLTTTGADKLADAIGGGPAVHFNEMIFTAIEPAFNVGSLLSSSGSGPVNLSSGQYSAGSFIPNFVGWALKISGSSDSLYSKWTGGEANGIFIENFAGLDDGFYYAEYSDFNGGCLFVPAISPGYFDASSEYFGTITPANVQLGETVAYEVFRSGVSSVEGAGNETTISATIPSEVGGFTIRGVYLSDLDNAIIAAAAFPPTYKPVGFEGGTSSMKVKAKIMLSGVGSAVINVNSMETAEQQIAAAPEKTAVDEADGVVVSEFLGSVKRLTFTGLWDWIKGKLDAALTIAGAKTFSGQVTLSGQAASAGGSAMTRDLVDARVSGPKFFAKAFPVQAVANSTDTKLNYASEDFDTANCYNTANSRFTPNKAGYYQVNISVRAATNANSTMIKLFKNGALYKELVQANNHGFITFGASAIVPLNGTTDYVEVFVWHNKGSALDFSSGGGEHTQFSAAYIH